MTYFYPTASNIAVFLNGKHVDQAYQLQYKDLVPKTPIFGYNDYFYSKIALGRNMIQGILVINFIFAGYLNTVLNKEYLDGGAYSPKLFNYDLTEVGETQKVKLQSDIKSQLRTELPPNSGTEERSARASYIASLLSKDKNTRDATKKALEKMFIAQDDGSRITEEPSPVALHNEGTTLDIYYQDPTYSTWFVRFNKVHFYEVSQVNSQAGAEGSSDPLYEIYSWVASKRTIKLVGEIQ